MKKIVINCCYGGFWLSYRAVMRYAELKGIKLQPVVWDSVQGCYKTYDQEKEKHSFPLFFQVSKSGEEVIFSIRDIPRDDPSLVKTVEELGADASTRGSELKIVEIPDDIEWEIEEYDGREWVSEKHRRWF